MIKANFNTYASYVTDSLYQWDMNQVLSVSGLNLSVAPEVHFSNSNMDRAIVRQATLSKHVVTVDIPNSLLQDPLTIKAHIGIYEGSTFKVVELVEIPVVPRKRPNDYQIQDSDEEIYSFKALENALADKASNARVDNIIANASNTGDNAELIDIRTGVDNTTYSSAGAAVRGQYRRLSESITDIISDNLSSDIAKLCPWKQGGYSVISSYDSPGENEVGTRIRAEYNVSCKTVNLSVGADYAITYAMFDTDGNIVAAKADWSTPINPITVSGAIEKIRIALKKSDDSNITPFEVGNSSLKIVADNSPVSMDEVDALSKARFEYNILKEIDLIPRNPLLWEQGGYSAVSDEYGSDSTARIRTRLLPFVAKGFKIIFGDTNYKIIGYLFDKNKNYIGNLSGGIGDKSISWLTADKEWFFDSAKIAYVNFIIGRSDDSSITPSDIADVTISIQPVENEVGATDTDPVNIKVMTYNAGRFSWGVSPYYLSEEQITTYLSNYRKVMSEQQCDIVGLQECNEYIGENSTYNADDNLFGKLYPYAYNIADWTAIKSRIPFYDVGNGSFSASGRAYVYGYAKIGGRKIFVINVHLTPDNAGAETRRSEYAELIEILNQHEYFICFGDFNATTGVDEFSPLTDAGFTLANSDWLGWEWTYSYEGGDFSDTVVTDNVRYLDNIVVSPNIIVRHSEAQNVYDKLTSDHIPFVAWLTIL